MEAQRFDVVVLGAGPGGLAAALAADRAGARVLLAERENRPGGILKQCVHDGFGLVRFGKKMAGPEYAQHFIDRLADSTVTFWPSAFAAKAQKNAAGVALTFVTPQGMRQVQAAALVLATGCRERTARQVGIHGDRPAGVLTAGAAQYEVNIAGRLPGGRVVILGSGDIGLIMARRLTLEGAKVLGVYEAKPEPGGLARNIAQCLNDFNIPLYTSRTVTRVFGQGRVCGVEVADVDSAMQPVPGGFQRIDCDCLILSVGLIPENELAERLGLPLDAVTRGPVCDQNGESVIGGVFTCGNARQVCDLVDYVSESGEAAGQAAAKRALGQAPARRLVPVKAAGEAAFVSPALLDTASPESPPVFYLRTKRQLGPCRLTVEAEGKILWQTRRPAARPPEMERFCPSLSGQLLASGITVTLTEET